MAPHLFKGLLVWYRRWAAIYVRACLYGIIHYVKVSNLDILGRPVLNWTAAISRLAFIC